MWKTTFKSLFAHKMRLALTATLIAMSVAFVAGTFVLGDTINHTFTSLFNEAVDGTAVEVRGEGGFSNSQGEVQRAGVPIEVLDQVKAVDGVRIAEPNIQGYAEVINKKGKTTRTPGGAPALGFNWTIDDRLNTLDISDGRAPNGPTEMTLDRGTAAKHDLAVGDQVKVLLKDAPGEYTIVGLTRFGEADNLGGATLASFDTATALDVLAEPGKYYSILVAAEDGVSDTELRDRIAAVTPAGFEAVTGKQSAADAASAITDSPGFKIFKYALLVFGLISLFVSAFIIANTFQILVAQRTRDLALLRALGASRGQVLTSVVTEAFFLGVVASAVGLGLGVVVAQGLLAMLAAFGVELPTAGVQFLPRTAVVSMALGVVVTTVAALVPARKASRIAPVAAMREATAVPVSMRRRAIVGTVVTAVGVGALLGGLFGGGQALPLVGLGAPIAFIGLYTLSPLLSRPLGGTLGQPLRWAGVPGKLASANAQRNPRRTAATASALMIGLALVGAVGVLASSMKTSFGGIIDRSLKADYILNTSDFMPFSADLARQLADAPGVAAVSGLRQNDVRINGKGTSVQAVDPASFGTVYNVKMTEGALADTAADGAVVSKSAAEQNGWKVGDSVRMRFSASGEQDITIKGIYETDPLLGDWLISTATYDKFFPTTKLDVMVFVKGAEGADLATTKQAVDAVAKNFPVVSVNDQAGVKKQNQKAVDQLLGMISALLLLSIVIAFLGIMNTLALSVYERTRELGLLRAVGMGRRQMRWMVRWEAVVISLFGAILGVTVGTFFGVAIRKAIAEWGVDQLTIPWGSLLILAIVGGVFGLVAAALPARRAARLNVLEAIAYE
jgi:putative ABC transport system permease protein